MSEESVDPPAQVVHSQGTNGQGGTLCGVWADPSLPYKDPGVTCLNCIENYLSPGEVVHIEHYGSSLCGAYYGGSQRHRNFLPTCTSCIRLERLDKVEGEERDVFQNGDPLSKEIWTKMRRLRPHMRRSLIERLAGLSLILEEKGL